MQIKNFSQVDQTKILRIFNLQIPAKNAQLGPPVGPALSQFKVKVKDFCDQFNKATNIFDDSFPIRVTVIIYKNQTFNFFVKTPSIGYLINNHFLWSKKKKLSLLDVYKFAIIKHQDLSYLDFKIVFKNILNFIKLYKIKLEK